MDGEIHPSDFCRFCRIVADGDAGDETILAQDKRFIVIIPKDGDERERLIISKQHVRDGMADPLLYGAAQVFAMEYAEVNMQPGHLVFISDVTPGGKGSNLHLHVLIGYDHGSRPVDAPVGTTSSVAA